jgi:hypothetical protein
MPQKRRQVRSLVLQCGIKKSAVPCVSSFKVPSKLKILELLLDDAIAISPVSLVAEAVRGIVVRIELGGVVELGDVKATGRVVLVDRGSAVVGVELGFHGVEHVVGVFDGLFGFNGRALLDATRDYSLTASGADLAVSRSSTSFLLATTSGTDVREFVGSGLQLFGLFADLPESAFDCIVGSWWSIEAHVSSNIIVLEL